MYYILIFKRKTLIANFLKNFNKITRYMTLKILDVYKKCSTDFKYDLRLNPRRTLTDPFLGTMIYLKKK